MKLLITLETMSIFDSEGRYKFLGVRGYEEFKATLGCDKPIDAINQTNTAYDVRNVPKRVHNSMHLGAYRADSKVFKSAKAAIIAEIKKQA